MKSQNKNLCVGDKIEIAKLKPKLKMFYSSQVLNLKEEEIFVISGPIHRKKLIMMHKDERIKISYTLENRGQYTFDAIVLKRSLKDIYQLEIKKMSDIKRDQRRRFYRLDISMPIVKEFTKNNETKIEDCQTKDISGSGLKIYSNFEHRVGDIIRCKFEIKNYILDIKGKIVRIEKIDTFDYTYSLGIEFIKLNEKDRDELVKFIFLKERLLREKELI